MMNIWVVASSYNSELYASTHLTRKGAFLCAIDDLYECMNVKRHAKIEEFWEDHGLEEGDEKPEWGLYELDKLRTMTADQLSDQFGEMMEFYWDTHDWGDRVEIQVINTKVQA